ncbi:MerR family transcriptional regulator [Actinocorallia sp. A-T 12471]|uniref:helix-turn-helix domain-containing protein n=1 Tax=Actinocorallia sp. A-T 12471 TaxID=3089813 RepID=UPI0029CB359F|nr:MerR family transcriptional regulator [Actinocorallia sp. A-T 12471]MDX6741835.1 MerR family transcriptional regulator [Actinocorallia sp. A-T 12471]
MDEWTITQLASKAAEALADLDVNGRVQEVPNVRLIRWYTTLGLLDPPLRQGRTARYTPRHLHQLVAVKRRQAAGLSLAEIQAELLSAPERRLTPIGENVDIAWSGPPPAAPVEGEPPARRFWAAPPAVGSCPPPDAMPEPSEPASTTLQGIRLAAGVTLLLETERLDPDQAAALRGAAAPLLAELARLGLMPPGEVGPTPS